MSVFNLWQAVAILFHRVPLSMSRPSECSRISAAFYYDHSMYFVIGEKLVSVNGNNHIIDVMNAYELDYPFANITAAVGLPAYGEFYILSGTRERGYIGFGQEAGHSILSTTEIERSFGNAKTKTPRGIDAAVLSHWGDVLYFSGCKYVSVDPDDPSKVSPVFANEDIGLPCDVDAAVYASMINLAIVIKGDMAWIYEPRSFRFEGPTKLTSIVLALKPFHLCPN